MDRKYSAQEINAMRSSVEKNMDGLTSMKKDKLIESRLQTYVSAGVDPVDMITEGEKLFAQKIEIARLEHEERTDELRRKLALSSKRIEELNRARRRKINEIALCIVTLAVVVGVMIWVDPISALIFGR
jgi:hypothetical protein